MTIHGSGVDACAAAQCDAIVSVTLASYLPVKKLRAWKQTESTRRDARLPHPILSPFCRPLLNNCFSLAPPCSLNFTYGLCRNDLQVSSFYITYVTKKDG